MVMDSLAAIGLATEPPHPDKLKDKRVRKHDRIFTMEMWRNILGQVVFQLVVMIILLYATPAMFNMRYNMYNTPSMVSSPNPAIDGTSTNKAYHLTFLFNTFMMLQLFNQVNCRKLSEFKEVSKETYVVTEFNVFERILNNWLFLVIFAAEFALQLVIVDIGLIWTLGAAIFGTVPLPFGMWVTSIVIGAFAIPVAALVKLISHKWLETHVHI